MRVVWSRGAGCRDLAEILGEANPVEGNLRESIIAARADLLVVRKLSSFDFIPVAAPARFDPKRATQVVAAVGGGPHSGLAVSIADRLASALGLPAMAISGSAGPDGDARAEAMLAELVGAGSLLTPKVIRSSSPGELVSDLPEGAVLVLGAPGGSWLQRQFFGPGRRLVVSAPGGSIIVRDAPRRCFQEMEEPFGYGREMSAGEAMRLMPGSAAPVLERGELVGVVRRERLVGVDPTSRIGAIAEEPVFVHAPDLLEAARELEAFVSPVPVIDDDGRLIGVIPPSP